MKKLIYFFVVSVIGFSAMQAAALGAAYAPVNGERYIFLEGGIEFSVYPDGEFDFVMPQVVNGLNVNMNSGPLNISFNTGFNYDAYVQYDTYGAVIQIADVPVYYDQWGRIAQAGNILINYNNTLLSSIGGLQIFYNTNAFSYTRGYVNIYNRRIQNYPYAGYLYRPFADRCLVYNTPYRRYYTPQRFSYAYHKNHYRAGYRDGYANAYRDFNRPQGTVAHNNARAGSYNEARNATSRTLSRSNADYARATRSSTNKRGATSTIGTARTTRRTAVAPQTSRTTTYSGRQKNSTLRSSASTINNNSSRTTAQRTSRNTRTQNVTAPSRSRIQSSSAKTSQSNRGSQQATRSSTSRSSRSSRSGGSRSGGN